MSVTIRILIQGTGDTAAGVHLPDEVVEALGKGKKPPMVGEDDGAEEPAPARSGRRG